MNQTHPLKFACIGQDVVIWPMAKIISPEAISLGDSIIIDDFVFLMGGMRTVIGSFVHIASHTSIAGGGEFIMEDFAGLSGGVRVYTGNEDYFGGSLTNPTIPYPYRQPMRSFVHIGKHAIIGANSVILPGVTIGQGTVIGANSLVTKNCKPWTIYAGSPVRAVHPRPLDRILELEALLRRELYGANGNYIPKSDRETKQANYQNEN
jgi:galactoside O-acetyltransferase